MAGSSELEAVLAAAREACAAAKDIESEARRLVAEARVVLKEVASSGERSVHLAEVRALRAVARELEKVHFAHDGKAAKAATKTRRQKAKTSARPTKK